MRRTRIAVVALVLVGATAACSSDEVYAAPDEVCGVAVDSGAVDPLLPEGKKLDQTKSGSQATLSQCRLSVDGKGVLSVKSYFVPAKEDPVETKAWELTNPAEISVGDNARVSDAMAIAVADCASAGERRKFVVQAYPLTTASDLPERREDLTRFMAAYFPKAQAAVDCTS
ncbi:hypothetical protein [Streptomyces sp. NBC_00690]|uniref:hypothetical protein n=1 Tax=Streptomyces sp. NBC_00690 TaxID=2975808 RepID=UPI002E2B4B7F|nr:hypothetical protein [Streptomyces sp. NBC_00690]